MSRKISFLIAPEFELLDLSGPLCAFMVARDMYDAPYKISIVSPGGGSVVGCSGVSIETGDQAQAEHGDTIVVVGGPKAYLANRHPETSAMLRALAPTTRRMASVCTGAFYLAEADVLDGRRATTHWRYAPLLQSRFPTLSVDMDRIFVNDHDVWTSAGISAGIDLALAMIEADFGPELSKSVARELVVYHRRPGGQSQFSAILELEPASGRVRNALHYAREHLHETLSVEQLADVARVSSRQFARIFLKETGETPARAVERLRAEAARPRIEEGLEPIEIIAREVGFRDVERMRRSFVKLFGQSPQAIRRIARAYAGSAH
jgi:transcriptional regulator GlxA family with amidase domain